MGDLRERVIAAIKEEERILLEVEETKKAYYTPVMLHGYTLGILKEILEE